MKLIYSISIADVELLLHRIKKHTFIRVLQKKEFEPHLTYMEEMKVIIDIGFSQPKRVGRESKWIDELREYIYIWVKTNVLCRCFTRKEGQVNANQSCKDQKKLHHSFARSSSQPLKTDQVRKGFSSKWENKWRKPPHIQFLSVGRRWISFLDVRKTQDHLNNNYVH